MERIAATVRDEAKAAREETCWWSQGHNGAVVAIEPRNIRTWAVLAQRMLAVEDTTLRVPFSSLLSRHATVSSTGVSRAWCIVPAMNGIESHLLKESESNVSFSFFFFSSVVDFERVWRWRAQHRQILSARFSSMF